MEDFIFCQIKSTVNLSCTTTDWNKNRGSFFVPFLPNSFPLVLILWTSPAACETKDLQGLWRSYQSIAPKVHSRRPVQHQFGKVVMQAAARPCWVQSARLVVKVPNSVEPVGWCGLVGTLGLAHRNETTGIQDHRGFESPDHCRPFLTEYCWLFKLIPFS